MFNRRKFIKLGAASAYLTTLSNRILAQAAQPLQSTLPVVISTWDFGIAANQAAWGILKNGGRALDAVENGVKVPESDLKNHSVGKGGYPDRDGHVTLDACIMDELGNCGSVAALEDITHAISVARLVMEKTPHVMLAGDGARQFALQNGFNAEKLLTPESEKAWKEWLKTAKYEPIINVENKSYQRGSQYNHDTIGMLALDAKGNISGACTTSGMAWKLHGRVGDSPIIGAGLYVDNEVGGATSTGVGEEVIRNVGSFLVVELMRQGHSPQEACEKQLSVSSKRNPKLQRKYRLAFWLSTKKANTVLTLFSRGLVMLFATASNRIN